MTSNKSPEEPKKEMHQAIRVHFTKSPKNSGKGQHVRNQKEEKGSRKKHGVGDMVHHKASTRNNGICVENQGIWTIEGFPNRETLLLQEASSKDQDLPLFLRIKASFWLLLLIHYVWT